MGIASIIMDQSVAETDLTAAEHLARELVLFRSVEAGDGRESVRLWETARPVVVVGRSTTIFDHVDLDACRADGVEVLRRSSGGGAVVLGPGCLNYAIAVSLVSRPELADVAGSFCAILGQVAASLGVSGVAIAGYADLALHGRKVSGNAQRRGRRALLHHGTLLYDFDPRYVVRYLKEPARQPAYRAARPHAEFLGNLPLSVQLIRARLAAGGVGT
jgi:lipoate---protein ligase